MLACKKVSLSHFYRPLILKHEMEVGGRRKKDNVKKRGRGRRRGRRKERRRERGRARRWSKGESWGKESEKKKGKEKANLRGGKEEK